MIACISLGADGQVGESWGRAHRVAVARVEDGEVLDWQEHEVGWDALHDAGTPGAHHARIARFLREHGVDVVLVGHMGDGMVRMLGKLQIRTVLGTPGDARAAAVAAERLPV
ncbi:NifB/NifX family molybdenum-iron cluster-binding protein [Cellulomonas phragmiteti]|uniref:Dinitrogenase iron-molybdenum cofactor biosynthesis domain-containing protein n=1 Tax=Cellulomonas phragmiteti TaxID=478780 RepID=A0ABQ4DNV1_9CELL|nr:NifB/NifX family molybdenum-iron cluster-binding protein [Cellulomonas phragmiteti]GIG40657.1 hypothetical protein Cph01nite_24190 [Cellulomonas phragmiteti]